MWNSIGLAALVQWNLSTEGTAGTQLASLIQRYICTQLYVVRTADSVLIREVSFVQSVLYREVPLYVHNSGTHCV